MILAILECVGKSLSYVCMCVPSQINHTPSEVIPHYMFTLSLGFTSGQPSLVGYTGQEPIYTVRILLEENVQKWEV